MTADPKSHHAGDTEVLEALIEGAPDGLALLSTNGQFLLVNEAATHLLGVRREDLLSRFVADGGLGLGIEGAWVLDVLASQAAVSRTLELRGGRKAMVTMRARRGADGQPQYLILVVRDVTGISQLVSRVQAATPTSAARWWQMRRSEVGIDRIVTESRAMRAVAEKALQFAQVDSPVLIIGETGTGKTLFSRIIHQASARAGASLREVNCGAIPAGLMESELFGYARGAFTGADAKGRSGLIELASEGTLLLDEIGDMPLLLQVKLLQFLEAGEVWPVGASKPKRVNVRVIAATNAELTDMVAQGTFRRDLFYRLASWTCHLPPLADRTDDIPLLAASFVRQAWRDDRPPPLTDDVVDYLMRRPYPGNIRELKQLVFRMVYRHVGHGPISIGDIPEGERMARLPAARSWQNDDFERVVRTAVMMRATLRQISHAAEEAAIRVAVGAENGSWRQAADRLGVTGRALQMRRAAWRKTAARQGTDE